MKKVFCLVFAVLLMFQTTAFAYDNNVSSYTQYEINVMDSNAIIEKFQKYYEGDNPDVDTCYYPEYFGGFQFLENGKILMYVTDDSKGTINNIYKICESKDISFEKVTHSFEYLFSVFSELRQHHDELNYKVMSFDLSANSINMYIDESKNTTNNTFDADTNELLANIDVNNVVRKLPYVSEKNAFITSTYPNDEVYSKPQTSSGASKSNSDVQQSSSTVIYPANSRGDGTCEGTVGFCALDMNTGKKLLVTHGHDLIDNTSYYYGNDTSSPVGTINVIGDAEPRDAAVIVLNDDISISNQIYGTSARIQSNYGTHASLASVSGQPGFYFRGIKTGESSSGTLCYYDDDRVYKMAVWGLRSDNGDSGGLVYTKTSYTSYKLAGIQVQDNTVGYVACTAIPSIKSEWPMYIYQSDTIYN